MNNLERMRVIFYGGKPDRFPIPGIHPWEETLARWHQEGLPVGRDCNQELGLAEDENVAGLGLNLNMVPTFDVQVLSKDDTYVTLVDEFGVTKMMLRADFDRSGGGLFGGAAATSSMSHWIDFPVKTMADWKRTMEERFRPDLKGRLPENWEQDAEARRKSQKTRLVWAGSFPFFGLFGPLRQLMGLEGLVYAIADDPILIHTIVDDLTDFWAAVFEQVLRSSRLDGITFFEDMCATKGPLMSPAMYREFLAPGYRKIIGVMRELGVSEFHVDSDGNFAPLVAEARACGITGLSPVEIQSGMEPEALLEAFPGFNLNGGIDKRELAKGPAEIEAEVRRRYGVAWAKGHYVPGLDHGAPPDISWANAVHYAKVVKESCLAPVR